MVRKTLSSRGWFVTIIMSFLMFAGVQSLLVTSAPECSEIPKLPTSYNSAEELYAALAKLPENERWEVIVKGAQKEGKVVLYGSVEVVQVNEVAKVFKQRFPGMEVEYFRASPDDVLSKMLTEVRANRWVWDVAAAGPGYKDLKEANSAAKHYRLVCGDDYPKQYYGEDWFAVMMMTVGIAYNTKMVRSEEAPKSYQELLDPKWKGKISIDASPVELISGMIKSWGRKKAEDWLNKFVNENQAQIRKGHSVQTKLLAAGEFPISSELYANTVADMIHSNKAPLQWMVPKDLSVGDIAGYIIARRAPHPYAALLWSRFDTTPEAQNIYASFGRLTLHPETKFPYPELKQLVSPSTRDRMVFLTVEDIALWEQTNELIQKYIDPRLRGRP